MSNEFLEPASQISTHFRCDNCGVKIDQPSWSQCIICKGYDLCALCTLNYTELLPKMRVRHGKIHGSIGLTDPIPDDCMQPILIEEAEKHANQILERKREERYQHIMKEGKLRNDFELSLIMKILREHHDSPPILDSDTTRSKLNSLVTQYHVDGSKRQICILSLDGGGVRGYMPIKVLDELIRKFYLSNVEPLNFDLPEHQEQFHNAQTKFRDQFDYFVGTSTGGLIAFCLAINYDISKLKIIYTNSSHYFKKNRLGPILYSKFDPTPIHNQIDEIINSVILPNKKQLSAQDATLLDIHNLLNPHDSKDDDLSPEDYSAHGNLLEFIDDEFHFRGPTTYIHPVKREKVLLITAYNTTDNMISVFNTSYSKHWPYRIADVLKATMAAPTYFPPQNVFKMKIVDGQRVKDPKSELCIDGGVFANDPELIALWAIRMQWRKSINYHLLSIGTGCYDTQLSKSTWGGYLGWLVNGGVLVNTLMDATRSLTEIVIDNLAKFSNMKRLKFNYKLTKSMSLDDESFVPMFNKAWHDLKDGEDFKALLYFYDKYILKTHN